MNLNYDILRGGAHNYKYRGGVTRHLGVADMISKGLYGSYRGYIWNLGDGESTHQKRNDKKLVRLEKVSDSLE